MSVVSFDKGDYHYRAYTERQDIYSISVIDKTKTSYGNIPSTITYSGQTWIVSNINSCFDGCTSLTTAPTIPSSVTDMFYCFKDCTSLTTAPTIPSSVTGMDACFEGCTSLTTAPTIPSLVTGISACFANCTSLTTAPTIPSSVTDMGSCFEDCTSLTTAPTIPSSVIYMHYCFSGCTSLTTAPTIPSSVTGISYCFYNCTSLTTAPTIPSSVTDMYGCFKGCTSLTTAPTIPSSVTSMQDCFAYCTSLSGNIVVNNTPTDYYLSVFAGAVTNTNSELYIVTSGSASASVWRTIKQNADNSKIHFEADDAEIPNTTIMDIYRTNDDVPGSGPYVAKKDPNGGNAYLVIKVNHPITTIPSGWRVEYPSDIVLTEDGSSIIGYWQDGTATSSVTVKSVVVRFGDSNQHNISVQASVKIYDGNTLKVTKNASVKTATLQKIYALMDMIHDDITNTEGIRIGGYAQAPGFYVSMDNAFEGNGYLVTDATDDAQLISDITALGWDDDVKAQIITSADNYYFGFTQSLTIPFETTPIDYDLDYEITGKYINVVIDNTQRTITLTATNSEYDQILTLSFNVGGYIFKKNLTISAQR